MDCPNIDPDTISTAQKIIDRAYQKGYEDGYDDGCMDMIDDDLGSEALEKRER